MDVVSLFTLFLPNDGPTVAVPVMTAFFFLFFGGINIFCIRNTFIHESLCKE